MKKMIVVAAALFAGSATVAATAQDMSVAGWGPDQNLLAMDPAESSAFIKGVGYQEWAYYNPAALEQRSAEGVTSLAMNTGIEGESVQAMGGPFEEVDTALMAHENHQGVGGPIESQSGYPPCDPGPGDDNCIQLYERGVTGAGN